MLHRDVKKRLIRSGDMRERCQRGADSLALLLTEVPVAQALAQRPFGRPATKRKIQHRLEQTSERLHEVARKHTCRRQSDHGERLWKLRVSNCLRGSGEREWYRTDDYHTRDQHPE